jgi:hypothetical protein
MNKAALLVPIAFVFFYFGSCTKDKTPQPAACIQADTLNTYTKGVKDIFDNACLGSGCHSGAGVSGVVLDTYAGSVSAVKTKTKFFCVIEQSCLPIMPVGGMALDTSQINALKRWRDNCFPE